MPFADAAEDRSYGALMGMAVGDAMGCPMEFLPLDYEANDVKGFLSGPAGKFLLKPGQWTDDTSMGLCLADSLLVKGCFDGHDLMHRFLAWWFCGLNNGHMLEQNEEDRHTSCGLGRTMKSAFMEYIRKPAVFTETGDRDSSGNGTIMRLAAVPVFFRNDIEQAEKVAEQQSYVTHQGIEAAECSRLMAHIMVRGLNGEDLRSVLDSLPTSFKTDCPSVSALAQSKAEPSKKQEEAASDKQEGERIDPDRNWNWMADDFKYSPIRARMNPMYIGSYAMDGLSMALHILYKTSSLSEALLKSVNLRGDADTVSAIVGQIGGSFYGCSSIPVEWKKTVMKWDNHEIALRAHRLYNRLLL